MLRSYCQSNYFYFQGNNLSSFCVCFIKNQKFLRYNVDTIKNTHFKCRFCWVLTNVFTLLISTTSKMHNVAMATNDFLVHYPSRLPPPLFPGNRWPALRLYRSGWPSLELNTDVKMGLLSFAQHDGLRFIHDVGILDSVPSPFSSGRLWCRYNLLSICLFTDIYIFSQFRACVNKAPVNIHRQIFVWTYVYVLCG